MKGLLTLSEAIFCKKEVLGQTFECTIDGISGHICFPHYPLVDDKDPKIGISNPLLAPKIGAKWTRGGETLSWGFPMSYPSGNSHVELLALSFDCQKEEVEHYAQKLYESIQRWEHAFIDYLKLETKQAIERDRNIKRSECSLELLDDKYIPNHRTTTLFATFPDNDTSASVKNIINAINFANSGKELLLEYQMLLSAYGARRLNQNRRAIMDACAAMEISLVNQIDLYCQLKGLDPRILHDKYRYLGERISLLRKISNNVPNENYKELVVDPRNSVMHSEKSKNIFPSNETTEKLIACVERFLNCFSNAYYEE